MSDKKKWAYAGIGIWLIVSVSSGMAHTNPPVTHKVNWNSPRTQKLFSKVCMDCHSHETQWPWYSYVAPMSFIIAHHVNEGREHFNVSAGILDDAFKASAEYEEGVMPEGGYIYLHPEAQLSEIERNQLISGLKETFPGEHIHHHDHGGHHH